MRFLPDERSQSIQIGAVLLFAVLIILLALWQAFVVPNQNEEVEFNHNEALQQQMTELRSTVNSMPDARTTRSVTLDLGVRYPSRSIFRNPPPARGTVRTTETTDSAYSITLANATARDENVDQLWDRQGTGYNTGSIAYRPGYNEYSNPPQTIYEHSVLYNNFAREQQQLTLTDQSLVTENRISLVAINGSLSESRIDSTSIDLEPISSRTREVIIEPDGGPITLELPTRLSAEQWKTLFEDEPNVERDNVTVDKEAFDDDELGLLRVELRENPIGSEDIYRLQLGKVGIGSGVTTEDPAYLAAVQGDRRSLQQGETTEIIVEVRDQFNSPVPGVTVNATTDDGTVDSEVLTGSEGRATFEYTAPQTGGDQNINFSYATTPDSSFDPGKLENTQIPITVQESSDGSNDPYSTFWKDPSGGQSGVSCPNWSEKRCTLDASVRKELQVTTATDPVAYNAEVSYSWNDSSMGAFTSTGSVTGQNGEATTTFEVSDNGWVKLYTSSGSSGDAFDMKVENLPEEFGLAIFRGYDGDDKSLASVELSTGTVRRYDNTQKPQALGPSADIDNNGGVEIPYVSNNGNEIRIVDAGNARSAPQTLYTKTGNDPQPTTDTRMGVGDLDQDQNNAVFFTDGNSNLYKYENGDEGLSEVTGVTTDVAAVAGVADISGANGPDLIFVNGDQDIQYYNPNTGVVKNTGVNINQAKAVGEPADFSDGDNDIELPYRSGNSPFLRLADKNGKDTELSIGEAPLEQPIGTAQADSQVAGDEIIFLNQTNYVKYATVDETTGFVLDSNGNKVQVRKPGYGIVAGKEP